MPKPRRARLVLLLALAISCTPQGKPDWTAIAKLSGSLLSTVALNYTGLQADQIGEIVALFTDQSLNFLAKQSGQATQLGYAPSAESPEAWSQQWPPAQQAAASRDALSLEVALVQEVVADGQPSLSTFSDGARLRDGYGRAETGDRFGVIFSTSEPAYVYVVSVDATGWAQVLFPYPDEPGFDNPVDPGREVFIPGPALYGLDQARGVETLFFLASRRRRPDLEQAMAPIRGVERPLDAEVTQARVTTPFVGQRGLTGVRPGANASLGRTQNVQLTEFFSAPGQDEIAFTRWFHHD